MVYPPNFRRLDFRQEVVARREKRAHVADISEESVHNCVFSETRDLKTGGGGSHPFSSCLLSRSDARASTSRFSSFHGRGNTRACRKARRYEFSDVTARLIRCYLIQVRTNIVIREIGRTRVCKIAINIRLSFM